MKYYVLILLALFDFGLSAQTKPDQDSTTLLKHSCHWSPHVQAIEAESLFPMFFSGGYHVGLGYRYDRWRLRVSVINGGKYNAESAGINNSSDRFKRYYKTSPGIFAGYNVWNGLETYLFLESHTFEIEQINTGLKKDLHSIDWGGGLSYQLFIGKYLYIQPGIHLYLRKHQAIKFDQSEYTIPQADISPVIRIGVRLWQKNHSCSNFR